MEKNKKVFNDLKSCCGCGACVAVCPKNAIRLEENKNGFLYPIIDKKKCINCGLCTKSCLFKKYNNLQTNKSAYVSLSKDFKLKKNASSGGTFSQIAAEFLKHNGIVFGSSLTYKENQVNVTHICITNIEELKKIQGSKYVKSETTNSFIEVKKNLEKGKKVLFSGTPCQIVGLKSFLKQDYNNLYTIDIVCHGVPSLKMFNDYLDLNYKNKILKSIKFRDKNISEYGKGTIIYRKNTKDYKKIFSNSSDSYYYYFQKGSIFRESCYSCPYASENRPADLTIGDYWGIEKEHPELLNKINIKDGVSCLIINNEKGKELLEKYGNNLDLYESSFIKIQRNNAQLEHPTKLDNLRDEIFESYRKDGYIGVEKLFRKKMGIKIIFIKIKNRIPTDFKRKVKKLLKK